MLEFGVFGPACDGSLTDSFRLIEAALLKVAEDESTSGFHAVGSHLAGLLENMRRSGEIVCIESLLALADQGREALVLRSDGGGQQKKHDGQMQAPEP